MKIELAGIELHGHHGALEEERERGQRFLFDVELEVGERGRSDRIEDAVDYRDVVACVREVSDARAYHLLEALAGALADELGGALPGREACYVRVRKPEVVLDPPVEYAAVCRDSALTTAYVGLGANLGDREATLRRARSSCSAQRVEVTAVSRFRDTEPVGLHGPASLPERAPPASRRTLAPRELLDVLLAVERELGRVREGAPRFGPRTIDLDLLLYGDETIDEPGLTVPHPRLHERRFVLEPLAELDPGARRPRPRPGVGAPRRARLSA